MNDAGEKIWTLQEHATWSLMFLDMTNLMI
jgi:hypothetical protein